MPRFLYATAILPGKTDLVRQVYHQKGLYPEWEEDAREYRKLIGLEGWQAWIHYTPRCDYLIHAPETRNLEDLFHALQEQIQAGQNYAGWLRNFYLDVTGKDYSHSSATPEIELLFNTEIPASSPQQGEIISRGYVYPLIPAKVAAHREFWRQCQGEYRYRIQDANREQGISKDTRFLHKTPHQDFLVTYQEMSARPDREAVKTSPAWKWLTHVLCAHTGLSTSRLEPKVESLTPQPQPAIQQLRSFALSSSE